MRVVRGMIPQCGSANMMMHGKHQLVFNELLSCIHIWIKPWQVEIETFFLILKALNLSTLELSSKRKTRDFPEVISVN